MAKTLDQRVRDGTLLGAFVYQPYRPQRPGKIIAVADYPAPRTQRKLLTVKWSDGTTDQCDDLGLNDFEGLIEECRRKVTTHETALAKLKTITD